MTTELFYLFSMSLLLAILWIPYIIGQVLTNGVRRHINWDKLRAELTESLAHLVYHIKRQTCGVASAGFQLSFV